MSLFIGNISKNVKKSELVDEFDKFGKCDINHKVVSHHAVLALTSASCSFLLLCVLNPLTPLSPIGLLRIH